MRTAYSGLGLAACLALVPAADAQGELIFDATLRTWEQAETNAQNLGGHLVSINSAEENAAVRALGGSSALWIGLNDIDSEGTFVWSDGSPVTYTNWVPGEPNDYFGFGVMGEDCTLMTASGSWNERHAASKRAPNPTFP